MLHDGAFNVTTQHRLTSHTMWLQVQSTFGFVFLTSEHFQREGRWSEIPAAYLASFQNVSDFWCISERGKIWTHQTKVKIYSVTGCHRHQGIKVKVITLSRSGICADRLGETHWPTHSQIDLHPPPLHTQTYTHKGVWVTINHTPHEWLLLPPTATTLFI